MDSSPLKMNEETTLCPRPVNVDLSTPESSPPKRRKIGPEEREEMRLKKEAERQRKEEDRLKKEEEKKRVLEERKKQAAEKEAEKKRLADEKARLAAEKEAERKRIAAEKETEKAEKEAERQRVIEEKTRLAEEKEAKRLQKEAEIKKKEQEQTRIMSFFNKKPARKVAKKAVEISCDFDKDFLPFHIKEGVQVASSAAASATVSSEDPLQWMASLSVSNTSPESPFSAKEIISHIQTAAVLNKDPNSIDGTPVATLLAALPRRYLQFVGDERPAYYGTFCKSCNPDLLQNPLIQVPGLDYDYDSEGDWEDEGEDVEDDEESDEDMEDDAEMADFVTSDEGSPSESASSRVSAAGPPRLVAQEPVLVWNSDLKAMSFDSLLPGVASIDPFKDYWSEERPFNVLAAGLRAASASSVPKKETPQLISGSDLDAFLKRVEGSDDNKALITEILCKTFPQYKRKMINATIQHYAERKGTRTDKRWVLKVL